MNKHIKNLTSLIVAFGIIINSAVTISAAKYNDVPANADYAEAVESLSAIGILRGYENGTFRPDGNITRAEVATVVVRALGQEESAKLSKGMTAFSDVPANHWASGYINVASSGDNAFINGMGDGTFAPDANVTYSQIIKMLVAGIGYGDWGISYGGYPAGYITAAKNLGITQGGISIASNDSIATRGLVAQLTYNAINTPILSMESYNSAHPEYIILDGTNGRDYETTLSQYHNIYTVEGRVLGTSGNNGVSAGGKIAYQIENTKNYNRNVAKKSDKNTWITEKMYTSDINANEYVGAFSKALVYVDDSGEATMLSICSDEVVNTSAADTTSSGTVNNGFIPNFSGNINIEIVPDSSESVNNTIDYIKASSPNYTFSLEDGCDLDVTSKIYVNYSGRNSSSEKPKYSYHSSDNSVLSVENNHVYMVGPGTATITISLGELSTSTECIVTDKRELENGEKNIVLWNVDGQIGDAFKKRFNVTWRYFTIHQPDVHVEIEDETIASIIDCSQEPGDYAYVELYAKKVGSTTIHVTTKYRSFSFILNVVPYREDDNLDELYDGVFFGPFGVRYENSTVIYQGRVAETNEEVRYVFYKTVDEVKEFIDGYYRDDMNDYEKIAAIYRYYSDNNIKYGSSNNTLWSWYGMLVEHEAVCEGACEATAMLARISGLEVYRCSSASRSHSWNMVRLNGLWYEIDFTAPRSGKWGDKIKLQAVNITGDTKVDVFLNQCVTDIKFTVNDDGERTKAYSSRGAEPIPLPIANTATEDIYLDLYGNIISD